MYQQFINIIKGRFTNIILLLISLFVTLITYLLTDNNYELIKSPDYYNMIFEAANKYKFVSCFSALFIMLFAAWMLFKLNEFESLTLYKSNLPFIFLIVFYLSDPQLSFISQGLILLLGMIGILFMIFSFYQQSKSAQNSFFAVVLMGLFFLFNNTFIFFLPFVFVCFFFMRSFSLKSLLAIIMGIISIKWIEFVYYFYNENTIIFLNKFNIENFINLTDDVFDFISLNLNLWFSTIVSVIAIIVSILTHHIKIKTQLCSNVIIFGTLNSLLLCYFNYQNIVCHQLILYACTSLFLSNIFSPKPST